MVSMEVIRDFHTPQHAVTILTDPCEAVANQTTQAFSELPTRADAGCLKHRREIAGDAAMPPQLQAVEDHAGRNHRRDRRRHCLELLLPEPAGSLFVIGDLFGYSFRPMDYFLKAGVALDAAPGVGVKPEI